VRRAEAIDYLGGVCVECGTRDDLQFHHVDPSVKSWNVSKLTSIREELFWKEIDKCELRCRECHIDHHRVENEHGTMQRYWQKCRCDLCKAEASEYNRQARQK
jgi:hypothetical protein